MHAKMLNVVGKGQKKEQGTFESTLLLFISPFPQQTTTLTWM